MPTRSALKKIARIQKRHGLHIDKSWEDLLDRHRSNKPSTRRTPKTRPSYRPNPGQSRHGHSTGRVHPDHTAFLKTLWQLKVFQTEDH